MNFRAKGAASLSGCCGCAVSCILTLWILTPPPHQGHDREHVSGKVFRAFVADSDAVSIGTRMLFFALDRTRSCTSPSTGVALSSAFAREVCATMVIGFRVCWTNGGVAMVRVVYLTHR